MREIRMSGSMRGCRKRATLAARLRPTPPESPSKTKHYSSELFPIGPNGRRRLASLSFCLATGVPCDEVCGTRFGGVDDASG